MREALEAFCRFLVESSGGALAKSGHTVSESVLDPRTLPMIACSDAFPAGRHGHRDKAEACFTIIRHSCGGLIDPQLKGICTILALLKQREVVRRLTTS